MAAALPLFLPTIGGWITAGVAGLTAAASSVPLAVGAVGVGTFLAADAFINKEFWESQGISAFDYVSKGKVISDGFITLGQQSLQAWEPFMINPFELASPVEAVQPLQATATPAVPNEGSGNIEEILNRLEELLKDKSKLAENLPKILELLEQIGNFDKLSIEQLQKLLKFLNDLKKVLEKSDLAKGIISAALTFIDQGIKAIGKALFDKILERIKELANQNPDKALEVAKDLFEILKKLSSDPNYLTELKKIIDALANMSKLASASAKSASLKALIPIMTAFIKKYWQQIALGALATEKIWNWFNSKPQAPTTSPVQPQPIPTSTPNTVG